MTALNLSNIQNTLTTTDTYALKCEGIYSLVQYFNVLISILFVFKKT